MKEIPVTPSQLQETSRNAISSNRGKLVSGQKALFGEILEQFNPLTKTGKSAPSSPELPELAGTYKASALNLPDNENTLTEKISESMDLLDTYASVLSNPENTLKQAYELLENLSEKNRQLTEELDQSPTTDQGLEKILTHLATLVKVEQIKINRGDYNDLPRSD